MKKIFTITSLVILSLTIFGCAQKTAVTRPGEYDLVNGGVVETGKTIDLSDLAGKTVTAAPGDILYIKLTGDADGKHQWYFNGGEAINFLTLKNHQAKNLGQAVTGAVFTDEWWLKVEKTGSFAIMYAYGLPGNKAEKTFQVEVVSQ